MTGTVPAGPGSQAELVAWRDRVHELLSAAAIRPDLYNPLVIHLAAMPAQDPNAELLGALKQIKSELGVPGEGYPAPVTNAWNIAEAAVAQAEQGAAG